MANRSIIITGAARGVGAACARRFARASDKLVLADVDEEAGQAFTDELTAAGANAVFVHADVTNRLDVHNIIAEALDAHGRIDVLAHTVMEKFSASFLETSEEDFDRIVSANIRGAFLINQAVAKHFVKRSNSEDRPTTSPGVIVNIGSDEAVTVAADHVAFAAIAGRIASAIQSCCHCNVALWRARQYCRRRRHQGRNCGWRNARSRARRYAAQTDWRSGRSGGGGCFS